MPSIEIWKEYVTLLGALNIMKRKENVILTGASGVRKSYLAQTLGHQVCSMGYKTIYSNTVRLFKKFKLGKMDDPY